MKFFLRLILLLVVFNNMLYAKENFDYYPHYHLEIDLVARHMGHEEPLSKGNYEFHQKNYAKSAQLYKESNYLEAKTNLAMLYFEGLGVRQNTQAAIDMLLLYADPKYNFNVAQYNLGVIYYKARPDLYGNVKKAKEWFGKACDNGMTKACDAYNKI